MQQRATNESTIGHMLISKCYMVKRFAELKICVEIDAK